MTFAITKVQAYGMEAEEPLNRRYRQYMMLNITAANTDTALDLGNNQTGSLGTFWTAVSGSDIGANALKAIQDISTRAETPDSWGGDWTSRAEVGATITVINSAASVGGSATETYTVTGLLTTDTIVAVTPYIKGGGSGISINSYGNTSGNAASNNALAVVYNADPGAGAKVKVALQRSAATTAGSYSVAFANKTPNFTFVSGDAPTSYEIVLKWVLMTQVGPVAYFQST